LTFFFLLQHWFPTISQKEAKSRPVILSESRAKKFFHKSIDAFCFIALTKDCTQNIRGVTERLLRAVQRMLGSCMRLSNSVWEPFFNKQHHACQLRCHSLSKIIKPKKHPRFADPLLQSGVVTRNNRV